MLLNLDFIACRAKPLRFFAASRCLIYFTLCLDTTVGVDFLSVPDANCTAAPAPSLACLCFGGLRAESDDIE